jgi:hypothetical protein
MLILAFGFLALSAVLEFRARAEAAQEGLRIDRTWSRIGQAAGVVGVIGPLVVMARVGIAEGAGAYLIGMVFAFLGGLTPRQHWPLVSVGAGVFGLGLLLGAMLA